MTTQIVKQISAPYLLFAANAQPTLFTIGKTATNNAEVTINGNLTVLGTQTTISTTNTSVQDTIITLNAGLAANASPLGLVSGIEINRGILSKASLVWSEETQHWQISNDGGLTFQNIATAGASGNYISDVVEDTSPQLGGNLDINGHTITSVSNNVIISPSINTQINSSVQLEEITTIPSTSISGFGLLYAGPVNGGGTGLYITHSEQTNQELISKKKAILYSLIF